MRVPFNQAKKKEETGDDYSYFITTLPINPFFLENDGVSGGVNEPINEVVDLLMNVIGLNAIEVSNRMNKSLATTERYLRILRRKNIVEFRVAPKTGGYYFTEKVNNILNE